MPPKLIILVLLACCNLYLAAQATFIKRYKNTSQPEGSTAVCNLPGNRIAIAGNQSLWGIYNVPMIIITDSLGNKLRHFIDTSCYECAVYDIASDSAGFIYIAGKFLNKAGLAKYDTLGNKIWQRQLSTNGGEAGYNRLAISPDGLIVAGGFQIHYPMVVGWTLIAAYDTNGDTLWTIDSNHGYTWQDTRFDILGIAADSLYIYATGYISDTVPQRLIFIRINNAGQVLLFKVLNNGRKMGYGIIPITPDSILIGGSAINTNLQWYSFLCMVDSLGNVAYTVEDSNFLYSTITKLDYNKGNNVLYSLGSDTLFDVQFGFRPYYHVEAHIFPATNLQQPLWEKTITGTTITGSYTGLKVAADGTLLHTGPDNDNCHCSYLLKTDANTCADLVTCDTSFVSAINIPELFQATFKIYPNPVSSGVLYIELQSDIPLKNVQGKGYDIAGKEIEIVNLDRYMEGGLYKGKLSIGNNLPNGMYFIKLTINDKYNVNGRFLVIR